MKEKENDYSIELARILGHLYTSKSFLESIINSIYKKNTAEIKKAFANILKYYIMSRDEKAYQSYDKYLKEIDNFEHIRRDQEEYDDICQNIKDGYITHSFYGKEGDFIKKYGLNYRVHLSDNEFYEYYNAKYALYELIQFFYGAEYRIENGGCSFSLYNYYEMIPSDQCERTYFSTPGGTTFLYSIANSPAALYEGPLTRISEELRNSIGDSKQSAIKNVLSRRVENAMYFDGIYPEKGDKEFIKSLIDRVVDFYCKGNPGFALVRISDIKNRKILFGSGDAKNSSDFKYEFEMLVESQLNRTSIKKKSVTNPNYNYIKDFFSYSVSTPTLSILEDFCAKTEDLEGIPVFCVPCFDEYDIIKLIKEMENPESAIRSKK